MEGAGKWGRQENRAVTSPTSLLHTSPSYLSHPHPLPSIHCSSLPQPLTLPPVPFLLACPLTSATLCPYRKEEVKEADSEKEAAMEAELRAARERAIVPLEARMTQFKDMLLERGVKITHTHQL